MERMTKSEKSPRDLGVDAKEEAEVAKKVE